MVSDPGHLAEMLKSADLSGFTEMLKPADLSGFTEMLKPADLSGFTEMLKPADLSGFTEMLKPADLSGFTEMVKPVDIGPMLLLLRDRLSVDPAVESFQQRTIASELAEWISDQLVEKEALQPKRWLSESEQRAVCAALMFILVGSAILVAMEAVPQVFDRWSAWVGTTTALTSFILWLLYQKQD